MKTTQKTIWLGLALVAAILLTRTSHFGTNVDFPDATLAVLFLGGFLGFGIRWVLGAIAAAFAIDFYAIGFAGVPDYCMSLGYWGLIPTYAVVWWFGKYASTREKPIALTSLLSTSIVSLTIAFVMSNAFWFAFSDKVSMMTVLDFSMSVAKYYVPYVGYAMAYLALTYAGYQVSQLVFHRKTIAN